MVVYKNNKKKLTVLHFKKTNNPILNFFILFLRDFTDIYSRKIFKEDIRKDVQHH